MQVLKRLKPDPKRDDVHGLLTHAATFGHADVVRYLLELGAKPNDKQNGGSTALDSFRFESFRQRISSTWYSASSKASKYLVSKTRDTIQLLLEHGALWRPDNARDLESVRRNLYECEPDVTLEFIEWLKKHDACSQDTLYNLLRTPAMKKHLTPMARKLGWMGFDVRTAEQKAEEERHKVVSRQWAVRALMSRYNREKIYEEIWSEPIQHVAKKIQVIRCWPREGLQEAQYSAAGARVLGDKGSG